MAEHNYDKENGKKANWHPDSSRQIERRFVIQGKLVLETPASFSNGETKGSEIVILEDALERKPLIPGASLAGALRHYLLTRELGYRIADPSTKKDRTLATELFGEALDDGNTRMESRVIVHDALGDGKLTRREGVKIDGATRTADDGMLFSTQVWEAGTTFDLRFELVLYKDESDDFFIALAGTLDALGKGEIPLGGRKQRGYGRVKVVDWHVSFYEMSNVQALASWLRNDLLINTKDDFFAAGNALYDRRQFARIEAKLQLCDSLLIRAASDVAETEHLTSDDDPILSGTSLAGALRARALKIANTVNRANAVTLVDDLFGKHGADGDKDHLSASRVQVEEHPITGGTFNYVQNRVKIDRFTGGAFETALFDERPLFADGETQVTVNLTIRYPADQGEHDRIDAQTGLLLLVLKDLWTEDLPLGGEASIGRGRLRGKSAALTFKFTDQENSFSVTLDEQGLTEPSRAKQLNKYAKKLYDYQGAGS